MRKILLLLFAVAIWSNTLTAQSYINTIEVKDTVQFNGSKFLLQCHLEVPEGKEVQELLSQVIFCEQGKTMQEAFNSFMNLWEQDKEMLDSSVTGEISINLRKDYELKDHFSCFHLEFSKKGKASTDIADNPDLRKKRRQYLTFEKGRDDRFIYDINNHNMVGVDDIFKSGLSEQIYEMFGLDINLYAEDRCLQIVSPKGDGRFIFSDITESNFSDYFKQLVGWGKQSDYDKPEFLHGYDELRKYFKKANFRFEPEGCEVDSVIISVMISADGSVQTPNIEKIPTYYDKNQLITLCRNMPKWLPAYQNGKPINKETSFVLRVKKYHTLEDVNDEDVDDEDENENEEGGLFEIVEQTPSFPGGIEELMKFLRTNLVYPPNAQANGKQGQVLVQFIVKKDGSIFKPKVIRSVDPEIDAEALRVVSIMPKWQPGKQRGKPVRTRFTIPVTFRLK